MLFRRSINSRTLSEFVNSNAFLTQGVALGWNLRTPSAFMTITYDGVFIPRYGGNNIFASGIRSRFGTALDTYPRALCHFEKGICAQHGFKSSLELSDCYFFDAFFLA